MTITLEEAKQSDIPQIIQFLKDMNSEVKEFEFNEEIFKQSVQASFETNVHWFLFRDKKNIPFGLCHCQSVHNDWRLEQRFYLGGFYISPSHRKKGHFKTLNQQLKQWAIDNHGVQIYAHIHKENKHSQQSFNSAGFEEIDYALYANHWDED